MSRRARAGSIAAAVFAALGCAPAPDETWASQFEPIVYDTDDRLEYFQHPDPALRRAAESTAALVSPGVLALAGSTVRLVAPSLQTAASLCAGERYAEQPAFATCTATLVGPDLLLTSGHCVRALPCSVLRVVFGGYYESEGALLTLTADDVYSCSDVLAAEVSVPDAEREVDYAWLRLDRPVLGRMPMPLDPALPVLAVGEPLAVVSHTQGVPLKLDSSPRVVDTRPEQQDYFVLSADTFHGSSGAAVYDERGFVAGVLARGRADYIDALEGCRLVARASATAAEEQATTVNAALDGLCTATPENALCGSPAASVASCSVVRVACQLRDERRYGALAALMAVFVCIRRRARPARGVSTSRGEPFWRSRH